MIEPGKLDTYIRIERNNQTTGQFNSTVDNWTTLAEVWAEFEKPKVKEIIQGRAIQIDETVVKIYLTDINQHDRIVEIETGQTHEVLTVIKKRDHIILTIKAVKK